MYTAKRQGRGRVVVFSDGMDAESPRRLELEADLYRAVSRDELRVLYQPTIDVRTGQITGVEALLRWQHAEHGTIMPGDFILIAEETGLIVPIGRWVFQRACQDVRGWQTRGDAFARLSIAVNLSARQLLDPHPVADVAQTLTDCQLDPSMLTLEITELLDGSRRLDGLAVA
jgi:EAL domain-containing protein (putative c-di-GMP-specific phosphodiesterase class I)